ncbi:MAG TPA: MarR family transcriptional regulator [Fodinibius sp.]|nr:MarR family transcriptional regulator [Fodinibius sp.]
MGFTVKEIFRTLVNEFEKADVQLTVEQYFLLNILNSEDGMILKELASIVERDKSAVLRQINSLESNQFVARATDPADKRRKIIFITRPGIRALAEAQKLDEKIDRNISSSVSENQLQTFESVLSNLHKSVSS